MTAFARTSHLLPDLELSLQRRLARLPRSPPQLKDLFAPHHD